MKTRSSLPTFFLYLVNDKHIFHVKVRNSWPSSPKCFSIVKNYFIKLSDDCDKKNCLNGERLSLLYFNTVFKTCPQYGYTF